MCGKFLGIVGQDPSDSKSSRLRVDIFQFFFIHLRYNLCILLKWSVILLKSPTSTGYFSNSTGSFVSNRWFLHGNSSMFLSGAWFLHSTLDSSLNIGFSNYEHFLELEPTRFHEKVVSY